MNFWQKLNKPFFVLAPMDDVTDTVFRRVVDRAAPADVYFTEFASVDGLLSKGAKTVARKLEVAEDEPGPLVAQIWGTDPDKYREVAKMLVSRGFDGIDINMGCPVKGVVKKGACSALIQTPELAAKIVQATKEGAGDLPVSVKTRIGFASIATEEWLGHLLRQDIAALTIHGRTSKEMSKVPAHWDEIAKGVKLRDQIAPNTVIIGNGDVRNRLHGLSLSKESGVDGIMIGRGIFQDLFAFASETSDREASEMLGRLVLHVDLFESTWGDRKNLESLRKYAKVYISGFAGAAEVREALMKTKSPDEIRQLVASVTV